MCVFLGISLITSAIYAYIVCGERPVVLLILFGITLHETADHEIGRGTRQILRFCGQMPFTEKSSCAYCF